MMLMSRFKHIADAYGADPSRWPEAVRGDMLAFAGSNAEAAAYLADVRELDRMLSNEADVLPSDALLERVMASAPGAKPHGAFAGANMGGRNSWRATAVAATLVLGVLTAWAVLRPEGTVGAPDLSDSAAWETIGEDLEAIARDVRSITANLTNVI